MNFLEAEHVISAHQFGFRRRLGTDDLLTTLLHHWAVTAGNGDSVHVLAIDIAGAFDKVSSRRTPQGTCNRHCRPTPSLAH